MRGPIPVIILTLALAGCGGNAPPPSAANTTAAAGAATQQEAISRIGDVTIRASAMPTAMLAPEVASRYGIARDDRTVMLLVAVRQGTEMQETSLPATITATVTNLSGQRQPITLRELRSDDLLDYVGTVETSLPDTLRFDLTIVRGLVRGDEFRALSEVFVWLAKVLRAGPFVRVPEPLYHRLDHRGNYHKQWVDWSDERKRGSWSTLFTGLMEATIPVCRTDEERLFFQHFILDRICVVRPGQTYHYFPDGPHDGGQMMRECLARLVSEGLGHLWQVPAHVVAEHETRVEHLRDVNRGLRERNRRLRATKDRRRGRLSQAQSRPPEPVSPASGWLTRWRRAR